MGLINFATASGWLTKDKRQIRTNYSGKKYKQAIKELRDFEKLWLKKWENFKNKKSWKN